MELRNHEQSLNLSPPFLSRCFCSAGHVYTFATPKLQPLITKPEGKNLIQACLNAPDAASYSSHPFYDQPVRDSAVVEVWSVLWWEVYTT